MTPLKRMRRNLSLFALTAVIGVGFSGWAAGCGSDDSSQFPGGNDGGGNGDVQTFGDGNNVFGNGDGSNGGDGSVQALVITPANPTVSVSITNGVVTATPVNFVAKTLAGVEVAASWSIDRGELGNLVAGTGVFTAGGTVAGSGVVSAAYGASIATTKVTVTIASVQIGNDYGDGGVPEAGAGGVGGVGGEGLGGSVDGGVENSLATGGTAPTSKSQLGFIYPYDKTVWPRGQLAPLLQWESSLSGISAVYIHLSETGYDFQGFYSVSGASRFHQPIDQAAWAQATNSNTGDNLRVDVKVLSSGGVVTGPITENWIVAPGILQGTVYYNSYRTQLAVPVSGETRAAAILSIKPGATSPTLALPGAANKCIVCHVVSDDGSTLFAQYGVEPNNDYSRGDSYDMADGGSTIATYTGNAADGTSNNRKFLWSAPWKDGTFALQSVGNTQEASGGPENIYRRDNGGAAPSTGLGAVNQAVTPAFSRDGKSVAFDGWTLNADAGLPSGNGHTLDVMDFACGAGGSTDGGPSCGSMSFSALRRVYTNADTTNGFVGWPAWTPDSEALVFHNVVVAPGGGSSPLATWNQAQAQLWYSNIPPASGTFADGGAAPAATPIRMNALNGLDSTGASYLPAPADVTGSNPNHSTDAIYNYEPTINPIASGGYYWVVFTSRRMYGNIATLDAFDTGNGSDPVAKKLWVAAIDINPAPGVDPSHPAFYLPGQEINAGNMRGFWVVDPCRSNGSSCETGDECCNGFCRAPDDGGGLVCGDKPAGCVQEFEKCTTSSDCCGSGTLTCINGTCSTPGPR
jgi:hypothetical protein